MATKHSTATPQDNENNQLEIESIKIGYVMPIAKTEGYPDLHWIDVMNIIDDTVEGIGIKKGRIVSDGGEITTIHSRIVNNLNDDDLIICDVSSRNPNVMFELGMRIAFDKPVIIIKDDATDYCFDSGTIEHIGYPKDLRHSLINKFQIKLEEKIKATYEAFLKNKDKKVSPILKNFGTIEKKDIELDEVSANEALVQDIQVIKDTLVRLQMNASQSKTSYENNIPSRAGYLVRSKNGSLIINLRRFRPSRREVLTQWLNAYGFEYTIDTESLLITVNSVDDNATEKLNAHLQSLLP
ncbi:hypothetical protein E2R52_12210 [Pantoea ananatis]|uniref:hypothetical protein n=1 Tax=Pantoea ananas TaxID=553 RepID=UPI00105A879D|nr:hypothetical protein [Pantoea ananatis]TDL54735.1 hypothetical protein E2R52_12210 [Pantoea ananatis]